MVVVAQLVRASVCGTEGRGFEPHLPPKKQKLHRDVELFLFVLLKIKSLLILIRSFLLVVFQSHIPDGVTHSVVIFSFF